MGAGRAWVLNLDAELELAGRVPDARTAQHVARARAALAATMPPGDVVLDLDPDPSARGREGVAWCPTPRALARLAAAGATVPRAPSLAILRAVNDRSFAFGIRALHSARRCATVEEAEAALARPGRWLARRALGFAGRGARRIDRVDDADRAWLRRALAEGALIVDPRVEPQLEIALHGHTDGRRGVVVVSDVDPHGQWRGARPAQEGELRPDEAEQLSTTFAAVYEALREAGYFGPFGIDAFRYRDAAGAIGFHPLSEINARLSMGWAVGMGGFA